jgi:hypothetical protein
VGAQDRSRAPSGRLRAYATFHPTFLYEFTWDLIGVRRPALGRPALHPAPARALRALRHLVHDLPHLRGDSSIDPSNHFAGERVNFWVSLVVWVLAVAFFIWWQFFHARSKDEPTPRQRPVPTGPRMAVPKGRVR